MVVRRRTAGSIRWCWRRPPLAGVDEVYRIGGAQAVAALAYGTATIARSTRSSAPATPMCGGQAPGVRQGRHRT